MLASVERTHALELLKLEHGSIQALIETLTPEEMTRPDTIRYGLYSDQAWSFKDLLAHLITYEHHGVMAVQAWGCYQEYWASRALQTHSGSLSLHYGGVAERTAMTLSDVLDEWDVTQAELEYTLANLSDEEWHAPAPYPVNKPTNLGGMVEAIVVAPPRPMYRHLSVHIPDVDMYLRELRG